MPALGLLIVATLGITNDVSGGFITDNTTRHYTFFVDTFCVGRVQLLTFHNTC
jgi:hypothetical protein